MIDKSQQYFERAKELMPGGVNSPVRSFKHVGRTPRYIESGQGCMLQDVDGNQYIDYVMSWGPLVLGHCNERVKNAIVKQAEKGMTYGATTALEVEMAELLIERNPHLEMVRLVNSGTEAVMSSLRVARGYSGRKKIVKFEGCYHGHCDSMLVSAGSGAIGVPASNGVTESVANDTLIAQFNDIDSVEALFELGDVAACIIEPIPANMGLVLPREGFLEQLRALCDDYGVVLIFDEVITGFRVARGGATEIYNVVPDMVTYGKIIGGGLPMGAFGGRREIMECVAPVGKVYQAGTLSGNPLAIVAGMETLRQLDQEAYARLAMLGKRFADGLRSITDYTVNRCGSLVCLFATQSEVYDYKTAMCSDVDRYAKMFNALIDKGVYIAPAQFEAMFVSLAHSTEVIDKTLEIFEYSLDK